MIIIIIIILNIPTPTIKEITQRGPLAAVVVHVVHGRVWPRACLERLLQVCPAQPSLILLLNYLHSATQQPAHACVFWTLQEVESQSWLSNNFSARSGRPRKLILLGEVKWMHCSVVTPQEVGRLR